MARPFLLLVFGGLLPSLQSVSAGRDDMPKDLHNQSPSSPHSHVYSPYIDILPEEISLVNQQPSLTYETRYKPYGSHHYGTRTVRQGWNPHLALLTPSAIIPLDDSQVDEALFNAAAEQMRNDLEVVRQRQRVLMKFVDCSCPNKGNCEKLPDVDDDSFRAGLWSWSFGNQKPEPARTDKFQGMIAGLKTAVEKLTLRQNVLYEYVSCSCTTTTDCSSALKPILEVMFANNPNVSGEIIQNLFSPIKIPSNNNFLNVVTSIIGQRPNINWFNSINFNPLNSLFWENLLGGASSWSFPVVFKPTSYKPFENFWNTVVGNKPAQSSGSVYTTGTETGTVTGTGGSVTVSSGGAGVPSIPSNEEYTINSPGGTTHVSSSTDGAGGSSVTVVSTSGQRDGRGLHNIVYDRLGIDKETVDNVRAEPHILTGDGITGVDSIALIDLAVNDQNKKQINKGERVVGIQDFNDGLFRISK